MNPKQINSLLLLKRRLTFRERTSSSLIKQAYIDTIKSFENAIDSGFSKTDLIGVVSNQLKVVNVKNIGVINVYKNILNDLKKIL